MNGLSTAEHFRQAVDQLVARLRDDRAILAALLCGSLAHDTVWASVKSLGGVRRNLPPAPVTK